MEAGGDVLYLIAATTFLMWAIIFERFMFISGEHKRDVVDVLNYWEGRAERTSWNARMIRERLISEVGERLKANMGLIKTLIALLPLLGLLGTVTGMVQVFEAMTYSGVTRAQWPQVSRLQLSQRCQEWLQRSQEYWLTLSLQVGLRPSLTS